MNKIIKLSDAYGLPARDIAVIHYNYYLATGRVTYTTDIKFNNSLCIENILLMTENTHPLFYWCHVEKFHSFENDPNIEHTLDEYSPYKFRGIEQKTWILFDKMELLPQSFTDVLWNSPELVKELVEKTRMNHKNI